MWRRLTWEGWCLVPVLLPLMFLLSPLTVLVIAYDELRDPAVTWMRQRGWLKPLPPPGEQRSLTFSGIMPIGHENWEPTLVPLASAAPCSELNGIDVPMWLQDHAEGRTSSSSRSGADGVLMVALSPVLLLGAAVLLPVIWYSDWKQSQVERRQAEAG